MPYLLLFLFSTIIILSLIKYLAIPLLLTPIIYAIVKIHYNRKTKPTHNHPAQMYQDSVDQFLVEAETYLSDYDKKLLRDRSTYRNEHSLPPEEWF